LRLVVDHEYGCSVHRFLVFYGSSGSGRQRRIGRSEGFAHLVRHA
jgi:hypothetical protein